MSGTDQPTKQQTTRLLELLAANKLNNFLKRYVVLAKWEIMQRAELA